jgi:hypothetical protein
MRSVLALGCQYLALGRMVTGLSDVNMERLNGVYELLV